MGQLSEHFSYEEMRCHCGCSEFSIDDRLLEGLEQLRAAAGKPVHINSAFRCQKHNKAVGGCFGSYHCLGKAADVVIDGLTPEQVAAIAEKIDLFRYGGIGIYNNFTHLDVRGTPARWAVKK